MDWDFGSDYDDDLVVPKEQDLLDMLPSSDIWLKWGISDANDYGSDEKYLVYDSKINNEELNVIEMDISADGKSSHGPDQLNYHLDELEQMDDIFLSSVLRDLPGNEDPDSIFFLSSESQSDMITGDDALTNSSLQFIPSDLNPPDCAPLKVLLGKAPAPFGKDSDNRYNEEESSPEGYVLHEFQMVMDQLPEKTRICFRDALYRLAQNSKQHIDEDLGIEKPSWSDLDETSRKTETTEEAKTNTIDRAIANLMFTNMDFTI